MVREPGWHENALGRLIGLAGRAMRGCLDYNLAQAGYDLSAEHMILLGILRDHEGVNQQTLTEYMFRDKTATTRWIDFLEEKKLVVRVPDKTDRRQKMIFLTREGKEMIEGLKQIGRLTEKDALQGIDPKEVAVCKKVLKRIRMNLE